MSWRQGDDRDDRNPSGPDATSNLERCPPIMSTRIDYVRRANAAIARGGLNRFSLPEDLTPVIARGLGSRVWDVDGSEYLDVLLGGGPLILGHAHPVVVDALHQQLGRGTTHYTLSPDAVSLAEQIVALVPCAERVKFTSTGSEAVQYAVRLARAATGRNAILKFEGGYHGHSEHVIFSYAPTVQRPFPEAAPECASSSEAVRQQVLVSQYNDLELTEEIMRVHGHDIACIVVEPVQRTITPVPGFLDGLKELAHRHGALLIFDEVVTGFRLALGGAQEFFGVIPDLAVFGKALGGGYPIAALAGRQDVMDIFGHTDAPDKFHFSGTFNGHVLGAVAANATLSVLREPGVYDSLHGWAQALKVRIEAALQARGLAGQVLGCGPWFEVVLGEGVIRDYRSYHRCDIASTRAMNLDVVRQGILMNPKNKCYVSLAHTWDDLDQLCGAYDRALDRVSRLVA